MIHLIFVLNVLLNSLSDIKHTLVTLHVFVTFVNVLMFFVYYNLLCVFSVKLISYTVKVRDYMALYKSDDYYYYYYY